MSNEMSKKNSFFQCLTVYNCRRVPLAPLSFKALANLVIGANQVCAAIFYESIINIYKSKKVFSVLLC
jgi:hypothetical protein